MHIFILFGVPPFWETTIWPYCNSGAKQRLLRSGHGHALGLDRYHRDGQSSNGRHCVAAAPLGEVLTVQWDRDRGDRGDRTEIYNQYVRLSSNLVRKNCFSGLFCRISPETRTGLNGVAGSILQDPVAGVSIWGLGSPTGAMLDTIVDEVFENECQLNLCTLRAQEKVGMPHLGYGAMVPFWVFFTETAGKDTVKGWFTGWWWKQFISRNTTHI